MNAQTAIRSIRALENMHMRYHAAVAIRAIIRTSAYCLQPRSDVSSTESELLPALVATQTTNLTVSVSDGYDYAKPRDPESLHRQALHYWCALFPDSPGSAGKRVSVAQ